MSIASWASDVYDIGFATGGFSGMLHVVYPVCRLTELPCRHTDMTWQPRLSMTLCAFRDRNVRLSGSADADGTSVASSS